jgi:hypothetical protein
MPITDEDRNVIDLVTFKNRYWEHVLEIATRIVSSDSPGEILADFVTALRFGETDREDLCLDPSDMLRHCAEDWGVEIYADDDELYDLDSIEECEPHDYDDRRLMRSIAG